MAHIHVLPLPHIPGRGPIVPPYKPGYMPTPPGPLGSWGSFAQTQGPSQDLGHIPGASSGASPSTNPFTSNNDDDNDDADLFVKDDDPR